MIDLNEAEKQSGQTIPSGVYKLRAKLKPKGAGAEGLLRHAKHGPTEMMELELTVVDGEHAGYTLTDLITVNYNKDEGPLERARTIIIAPLFASGSLSCAESSKAPAASSPMTIATTRKQSAGLRAISNSTGLPSSRN